MIPKTFLIDGKEVSRSEYSEAFETQNLLYGCAINRTSMTNDGHFVVELIGYEKVWKQIGAPEPVEGARDE